MDDQVKKELPQDIAREAYLARIIKSREDEKRGVLENLRYKKPTVTAGWKPSFVSRAIPGGRIVEKIEDATETKRKELDNRAKEQDIELKKQTLHKLFFFLSIETAVIFLMAIFQGFNFFEFYLEEWSFRLLVTVTISQITIMLLVAVKHLFPQKN